jgi:hypothetical protein
MLDAGKMSGCENGSSDLFHRHIPARAQIHVSRVLNYLRKALDHIDEWQASPQFEKTELGIYRQRIRKRGFRKRDWI